MADPRHSRDTDNGRYYVDPKSGELLISVTNALNALSKPALAPAAAKVTAEYVMDQLPAAVRASRTPGDREAFLKAAKAEHRNVWEARAGIGTRVHIQAEAHALGRPAEPDEDAEPFINQYRRFLDDAGVNLAEEVEAVEVTVLHRTARYAGTADVWLWLRSEFHGMAPGLWLIDIKTSQTKPPSAFYRDHVLQLAGLRYAEVALAPDDSEHEVPPFAGAAILNLRTDRYGLIPAPADEAAHAAFRALVDASYYLHDLDLKACKPVNPWKYTTRRKAA
ncbi:hypothetical protein [Nocardiopsis oceani]